MCTKKWCILLYRISDGENHAHFILVCSLALLMGLLDKLMSQDSSAFAQLPPRVLQNIVAVFGIDQLASRLSNKMLTLQPILGKNPLSYAVEELTGAETYIVTDVD